jgi:hypothetical protein
MQGNASRCQRGFESDGIGALLLGLEDSLARSRRRLQDTIEERLATYFILGRWPAQQQVQNSHTFTNSLGFLQAFLIAASLP